MTPVFRILVGLVLALLLLAPLWLPHDPLRSNPSLDRPPPTPPSRTHWLGTDNRGRDLLARTIIGARNSFLFAFSMTMLALLLGVVLGSLSLLLGGISDFLFRRGVEAWEAIPYFFLVIFLVALDVAPSLVSLTLVYALCSWTPVAAHVRAQMLRLRAEEFLLAARGLGASPLTIFRSHGLIALLPTVQTFMPFLMIQGVGALSAMEFLGLGLPPPTPTLGELLDQGRGEISAWWLWLPPSIVLLMGVVPFALSGNNQNRRI